MLIGADALCWLPVRRIENVELLGFLQMRVSDAEIGNLVPLQIGHFGAAQAPIGIAPSVDGATKEAAVCATGSQDREFWRNVKGFVEVPRAV